MQYCHVLDELQHLVGVNHLVVVLGQDLRKGLSQSDAGLGTENRGARIAKKVAVHHVPIGVTRDYSCEKLVQDTLSLSEEGRCSVVEYVELQKLKRAKESK